jgi:hypothetical protein
VGTNISEQTASTFRHKHVYAEDGGNMLLQNAGTHLVDYMVP